MMVCISVNAWPPNSPEMNPIKILHYITTNPQCMGTGRPAVDIMVPDTYRHLIESMPHRVATVLWGKGGSYRLLDE